MKIWVNGSTGRMGRELISYLDGQLGLECIGSSSLESPMNEDVFLADAVIDFSTVQAQDSVLKFSDRLPPIVVCTTGFSADQITKWDSVGSKVLLAPNTSLGVISMRILAKKATELLHPQRYQIEIVETHHKNKVDSPSGTALSLGHAVEVASDGELACESNPQGLRNTNRIGIHGVRGGGVFGEHSLRFIGEYDELTISHRAFSRTLFAEGAVHLTKWLVGQSENRLYSLEDVEKSL